MTAFVLCLTACGVFLLSALWLCQKQPARLLCALSLCKADCDEDGVRLASGKSSSASLDPSEEEISRYFKHKQAHNIEAARRLGIELGEDILSFHPSSVSGYIIPSQLKHVRMLYLFVTEDCVRQFIQDSILRDLILTQINNLLSERLSNFFHYGNVSPYRSYTVYKMCLDENRRSFSEEKAVQIGRCWAKILGEPENESMIALGKELYLTMKDRCIQRIVNTSFVCISA